MLTFTFLHSISFHLAQKTPPPPHLECATARNDNLPSVLFKFSLKIKTECVEFLGIFPEQVN